MAKVQQRDKLGRFARVVPVVRKKGKKKAALLKSSRKKVTPPRKPIPKAAPPKKDARKVVSKKLTRKAAPIRKPTPKVAPSKKVARKTVPLKRPRKVVSKKPTRKAASTRKPTPKVAPSKKVARKTVPLKRPRKVVSKKPTRKVAPLRKSARKAAPPKKAARKTVPLKRPRKVVSKKPAQKVAPPKKPTRKAAPPKKVARKAAPPKKVVRKAPPPKKRVRKKRKVKPQLPLIDDRSKAAEAAIQDRLVSLSQMLSVLEPGLDMSVQSMVNIDKTVDGELRIGNLPDEWREPEGLPDLIATFSNAFASFKVFERYPPMGGSFWFSVAVRFGPQNEMEMGELAKLYKRNKGLFQIGTYPTRADHPAPLQICLTDDRQGLRSMIRNLGDKRGLPPTAILVRLLWGPDWHPDVSGKRPGHYMGEK